jgi:tripartite-type tricarboxylate transporter receptor subunit TctC
VLAPAATPQDVVQRINAEVVTAVRSPATSQHLLERGMIALTGSPADFAKTFDSDVDKWRTVIRTANIKLE